MFRRFALAVFVLVLGTTPAAIAAAAVEARDAIRIGVVVDRTGPAAGPDVEAVLDGFERRVQRAGGVFGIPLQLVVRDGRSDPSHVRDAVEALVRDDRVHAVVCCTSPAEARAAVEVAEAHDVMLLAIAPTPGLAPGWSYGLGASDRTELRAIVHDVYAEGKRALALMTLANSFGDLPQRVLEEELPVADMALIAVERYRPDVSVLTPEALWIATRQPGAVVVWGLARDTSVAVDALRSRGFEGPVYVRPEALEAFASTDGMLEGVRVPVAPIVALEAGLNDGPAHSEAADLADMLFALYGLRDVGANAARAHDALSLLYAAAEQAALYGVPPDDVPGYRLALRDAAIALPPFVGAGGTYDLSASSDEAALPRGLVVVEARAIRRLATP